MASENQKFSHKLWKFSEIAGFHLFCKFLANSSRDLRENFKPFLKNCKRFSLKYSKIEKIWLKLNFFIDFTNAEKRLQCSESCPRANNAANPLISPLLKDLDPPVNSCERYWSKRDEVSTFQIKKATREKEVNSKTMKNEIQNVIRVDNMRGYNSSTQLD